MVGTLKGLVRNMTSSSSASKHDKFEITETANSNNKMNYFLYSDIYFFTQLPLLMGNCYFFFETPSFDYIDELRNLYPDVISLIIQSSIIDSTKLSKVTNNIYCYSDFSNHFQQPLVFSIVAKRLCL